MSISVLKKNCKRCNKSFLTREEDMIYCNTDCEMKNKYYAHLNKKDPIKKVQNLCAYCGDICTYQGKFCNKFCSKNFEIEKKTQRSKEDFLNEKKKPTHRLPYEVLNKMEEKKRVFEDSWWNYNRNRERI
jgi:hypothetical protein